MKETQEINGVVISFGALVRPQDDSEKKYRRAKVAPAPSQANLNVEVSLVTPAGDPRPAIFDQGGQGSCSSCSGASADQALRNFARIKSGQKTDAKPINPGTLYAWARQRDGFFPSDSGSYMATNLDLLLNGAPLLSSKSPYRANPSDPYKEAVNDPSADYEKSHQPFYPNDGNTLEQIWLALNAGSPVQQACYWANAWSAPKGGKIPSGVTSFTSNGHATYIWGMVPGFVLCANSWSEFWSPDGAQFGSQMRAGDFAIPFEYYLRSNVFWEFRVLSSEPVPIDPPDPLPDPGKVVFDGTVRDYSSKKLVIVPSKPVTANIADKRVLLTSGGHEFTATVKTVGSNRVVLKSKFDATWDLEGQPIHGETV